MHLCKGVALDEVITFITCKKVTKPERIVTQKVWYNKFSQYYLQSKNVIVPGIQKEKRFEISEHFY